MEKKELTSKEKEDLRRWYYYYKNAENKQERLEVVEEFNEKYSNLDIHISDLPEHIYSKNQLRFIEDAEDSGLEIDYGYDVGSMLSEDVCPSVRCDSHNDLKTTADTEMCSIGKGRLIIYAPY